MSDSSYLIDSFFSLMVLDEMDSLRSMGSGLFSRIFTWPEKSDGNVFIIGKLYVQADATFIFRNK